MLTNRYAAVEKTVNWYCTPNESKEEQKFTIALDPFPGNARFSALPVPPPFNQPCRGLLELQGVAYGVNGDAVFSIRENGTYVLLGRVQNDQRPVSMVANGTHQIFIASAGQGYVLPAGSAHVPNSMVGVDSGFQGAAMATFQDGYVLVIKPNSNQYQISGTDDIPLGDARKWSAAKVSVQAGMADNLRAIISSREYVRLLGDRRSQVHYNIGNSGIGGFPFQIYNATFIETGIEAPFSLADLGDALMWIGKDKRGTRACWHDRGFSPQRVSTFAVEAAWKKYARIDDARAFAFIWEGHLMYQISFPSAKVAISNFPIGSPTTYFGATWVYDATASELLEKPVWVERSYQMAQGFATARSEQYHCYCYDRHLVGSVGLDGNPGAVYQLSATQGWDSGVALDLESQDHRPIIRDRITPHIWQAGSKRLVINKIGFSLSVGVGLDGTQQGTDPQLMLRWSKDGGNTWGAERELAVGHIGEYEKLVYLNRLGYARDFVVWLRCSEPVYWSVLGASLEMAPCAS